MKELTSADDLLLLFRAFYARAGKDEFLSPFFATLNLETHLPHIISFWESLLFGAGTYSGDMMGAHIRVHESRAMQTRDFEQWVKLLHQTTDDFFEGEKATELKNRAQQIAQLLSLKFTGKIMN